MRRGRLVSDVSMAVLGMGRRPESCGVDGFNKGRGKGHSDNVQSAVTGIMSSLETKGIITDSVKRS
jgi:hypothetical protein